MQFVSVPLDGVPSAGVISTGEVSTTNFVPVPVCEVILVTTPTEVITPLKLDIVLGVKSGPPIAITLDALPKPLSPYP